MLNVCVIRAAGINCDRETVHAWRVAGAEAQLVHVRELMEDPQRLEQFQVVTIPGGFSYGDDLGAGKILAEQLHLRLEDALRGVVDRDGLLIGICNGFQVLVKAGLLPGGDWGRARVSIVANESARFEDRWVRMVPASSRCVIVAGISSLQMPVAHGEGRVVTADGEAAERLRRDDCIALRYVGAGGESPAGYPANPSGSLDDIAALTDATGRVFGLMPHPERHIDRTQHPLWTRRAPGAEPDGLRIFRNAVEYFAG
ncbi:MAG TPA: phosphoribosylformylglycinamidine synthase I [Phycisphaerae bacterium]